MKYQSKSGVIEASQWFKNGDHPNDYDNEKQGFENGELRTWTGAEVKAKGWEGQVVRYFRHPNVSGNKACDHCTAQMHDHGWIDTPEGGRIVCPGDLIITATNGKHYPCKSDLFSATYKPAK